MERHIAQDTGLSVEWLAGFFDGEGSPGQGHGFGMTITQKEIAVLEAIQSAFGGSVKPCSKDGYYVWRIFGSVSVSLAFGLLKYMHSPYKIEQLTWALIRTGHLGPRSVEEAERAKRCQEVIREASRKQGQKYYREHYQESGKLVRKYIKEHPEMQMGVH